MKKYQLLCFVILCTCIFCSCSSDEEKNPEILRDEIVLDTLFFDYQAQEKKIDIAITDNWKIRKTSEWIEVTPNHGTKLENQIKFIVDINTTNKTRIEVLFLEQENGLTIKIPIKQSIETKYIKLPELNKTIDCSIEQIRLELYPIETNLTLEVIEQPEWVDSVKILSIGEKKFKAMIYITSELYDQERKGNLIFGDKNMTSCNQNYMITINPFTESYINVDQLISSEFINYTHDYLITIADKDESYIIEAYHNEWTKSDWITISENIQTRAMIDIKRYSLKFTPFFTRCDNDLRSSKIYIFPKSTYNQHISAIDPIEIKQKSISYMPIISVKSMEQIKNEGETRHFNFTLHKDIKYEIVTNRWQSIGSEKPSFYGEPKPQDYWIHISLNKKELDEKTGMITYYYTVNFDADNLDIMHEDYNTIGRQAYINIFPLDENGNRYIEQSDDKYYNKYLSDPIYCWQIFKDKTN